MLSDYVSLQWLVVRLGRAEDRSLNYNSGWGTIETFHLFIEGTIGWRNDYRERWRGHPWNYQRIPYQQVQGNWRNWQKEQTLGEANTWVSKV